MSSLRERLLRHKKASEAVPAAAEPEFILQSGSALDEEVGAAGASSAQAASNGWEPFGGHMEHNEWGSFVLRRRSHPSGFAHGKYVLSSLEGKAEPLHMLLARSDGRGSSPLNAAETADKADTFHERLLFMDTETTGLGIGAGNVPFMIGIGFYTGGSFTVEQMLIRHPGEEIAMLAYLQEKLKAHPVLISYNGKSFDWPIVKNRYIMNRMPLTAEPQGHIDFLYPSRSLWKHTLSSCRLGNVEEERLMVRREDDVPGSLAPALYFQYLAEKDPSVLQGVFVHNELDILSLAGLAVHFAGVLSGRIGWRETMEHGYEEWFRLGLWLDKVGQAEAAEAAMDSLTEVLLDAVPCEEEVQMAAAAAESEDGSGCLLPLARYYKQHGRYEQACMLWERYIALKGSSSTASLEPYIELSMHFEHREKRWEPALKYAELALDKLWQRGALKRTGAGKLSAGRRRAGGEKGDPGAKQKTEDAEALALEKRIARLKRKACSGAAVKPQSQPQTKAQPQSQSPSQLERKPAGSGRRKKQQAEQLTLPLEQSV